VRLWPRPTSFLAGWGDCLAQEQGPRGPPQDMRHLTFSLEKHENQRVTIVIVAINHYQTLTIHIFPQNKKPSNCSDRFLLQCSFPVIDVQNSPDSQDSDALSWLQPKVGNSIFQAGLELRGLGYIIYEVNEVTWGNPPKKKILLCESLLNHTLLVVFYWYLWHLVYLYITILVDVL